MFQKHITTDPTGELYEYSGNGVYYRIYEVENGRYIDPDNYLPFIQWGGLPEEVVLERNQEQFSGLTIEDRLAAIEMALLEL